MPVAGREFARFGGRTTCFSLETEEGIIVIDAGTGIAGLSTAFPHNPDPPPITILFTHFHIDHVIGLPAFGPLYNPKANVTLLADARRAEDWTSILKTVAGPPLWPLKLETMGARIRFETFQDHDISGAPDRDEETSGGEMDLLGVRISWRPLRHPQQCVAFRIQTQHASVVVATDREHGSARLDEALLDLAQGADFLIYDAQYTPEEYPSHKGWGHSTWLEGARVAAAAGVGKLILTHHNPPRSDREIDEIVIAAKREFRSTAAAYDGMSLEA